MNLLDRLFGRPDPPTAAKASLGGAALVAYQNDVPLSVFAQTPTQKAARYLAAYRVNWFYKAESKISRDIAGLDVTLANEDEEGDNATQIAAPPSGVPFDRLTPAEQLLRLMESPNPYQSGRSLRQRTQIRLDMAGSAFWYLEGGDGGDLPTGIYGISPSRLEPSLDKRGQLIGWVMDRGKNGGPGVPFSADEILPFVNATADDDLWCGMGVVEAVYAQVPLTDMMARHTADVLQAGGRLAGMAWPKNRALDEDEFLDAQRAWRNVASDPNAARRLLLFPEPMEFSAGAATPKEIGIPELAVLSRDEILTAFPISPYQLGVPMPGGLNSAETKKEDRRDYWLNTIHPRAEFLEEVIQNGLVTRYEGAMGSPLDFDFEEPNLDDAPTIIEKIGALRGLIALGFDPKESIDAVELDHIAWNGLPPSLDPNAEPVPTPAPDPNAGMIVTANDTNRRDMAQTVQTVVGKARITRDEIMGREFTGLQGAIENFLREQRLRVMAQIEAAMPRTKAERAKALPPDWWNGETEDAAFLDALRVAYRSIGHGALQVVADNTSRIIPNKAVDRVLTDILARAGLRIHDINETTRKTIAETLQIGTRRGYSIPQLVNGVPEESFGGVQGALLANGVNVWDPYRAEVIARTETTYAYNTAALSGYKQVDVRMVQAIDGDQDEQCAGRNGREFTVDEAMDIQDHPNGTLDWVPLT